MNFRTKSVNILRQNLASARSTMLQHGKAGGDKTTHDRAKLIYESALAELKRRGVK